MESDNDSVATDEIVEIEVEPEPVPEPEPEPEPELKEPTKKEPPIEELKQMDKPEPKKRGRKPNKKVEPIKTQNSMSAFSKAELIKLVHSQQVIIADKEKQEQDNIKKSKEHIESKLVNKVKKEKVKKPRTAAQIAATAKLVERNRKYKEDKRNNTKKEIKKEVKDEVDKDISNLVQDELVKIIQAPLRSLTPERMKKVKGVEDQNKKYKNKF